MAIKEIGKAIRIFLTSTLIWFIKQKTLKPQIRNQILIQKTEKE